MNGRLLAYQSFLRDDYVGFACIELSIIRLNTTKLIITLQQFGISSSSFSSKKVLIEA